MNNKPKFELISKYENDKGLIPFRSTKSAAGYDFKSAEDITIPPFKDTHKVYLIPTGVKSFMPDGVCLQLVNRSSNAIKRGLVNPNGYGLIDADYYNNEKNEGHIMFPVINIQSDPYDVKKGDRICQGVFLPYITTQDDDKQVKNKRTGGFGSSDNQ
ncbi:dUTP diphosphatase [Apilactobacillus timberlakei]|uniref:dUTP diphosphatase n=1 Tax=Apilactobacillus timberlakei TaxID=2008380 RepID=UPI00112E31E1|nr:dUTP diphosphatase [Apilactobacillus timberlakei]TPR15032.1 dUTP diphosphatase [Apilactobacillus timberlakei]